MDDRTSDRIRDLAREVGQRPTELPVEELVELVEAETHDLTVDLTGEPAVVYAKPRRHAAFDALSDREHDVARLIASGFSNPQIADALFISVATVKDHVHSILTKTGFSNRSQVIAAWLGSPL